MQSPDKTTMDDLARNNIALQRLSLIHLKCIQWAQAAEAAETEKDRLAPVKEDQPVDAFGSAKERGHGDDHLPLA